MRLKFTLQVLAAAPGWLAYLCPLLPLAFFKPSLIWAALLISPATLPVVVGLILIPPMAVLRQYKVRQSTKYPGRAVLAFPGWMDWLNNSEDGIDGSANEFWPVQPSDSWALVWQIIRWSAWRNSAGNARWLPFYGMTVDGSSLITLLPGGSLKEGPYVALQGWRGEIRFCWNPKQPDWTKRRYFVCGWRIANTVAPESGVGFAFQPFMTLT